jgi:hypothetical protein
MADHLHIDVDETADSRRVTITFTPPEFEIEID